MTKQAHELQACYWRLFEEKFCDSRLSPYLRMPESEIIAELCRQNSETELDRVRRLLTAAAETDPANSRSVKHPRVVLTNHGLEELAGSELWTRDVAEFLVRNGVEVAVYSPRLGRVADLLSACNIMVTSSIDDVVRFAPELIHIQHSFQTRLVFEHFKNTTTKFVNMVHGVLPREEIPQKSGIDQYVCVSIATKAHVTLLTGTKWDEIKLVPNFFDERRFYPRGSRHKNNRALLFSMRTHAPQVIELRSLLQRFGYELDQVGPDTGRCETPELVLGKYELAFAVGRSAIEALASGCQVILWEDGVIGQAVTPANFWQCVHANFALFAKLIPYCFVEEARAPDWIDEQLSNLMKHPESALTADVRKYLPLANVGRLVLQIYHETL
jgi:hypothetical protein